MPFSSVTGPHIRCSRMQLGKYIRFLLFSQFYFRIQKWREKTACLLTLAVPLGLWHIFFKSRIPSPKVSISRTKEEGADRKFVANQVHTRARLSAYAPTEHTKNIGKEEGNYWWQILIGFHWQRRKKGRAGDNFVNIFSLLCRGIGDVVEKCNEKGGSDRWPCSSSVWRKSVMTPSDDICVAPRYRLIKQVEALRRRISAWCHSWLLYSNDVCIRILDRNKGDAIREQVT